MSFRNFLLLGDEQIASLADKAPFKAERLIGALEEFVAGGPSTLIAREPRDRLTPPALELHLIPSRYILRAGPDAMAIVLVIYSARRIVLISVDGGSNTMDEETWHGLTVGGHDYLRDMLQE